MNATPSQPSEPAALSPAEAERAGSDIAALQSSLNRVVLGQENVVHELVVALLAGGHVLLEGVPGTAKTLLVKALAASVSARFGRVQFTPDLMPSDVTGIGVLRGDNRSFDFVQGPVFTDLLLADEINRAPAKTQSALLEAMEERRVTADGVSHGLGDLFTVFATQNGIEFEGTYPLPEAQLDRFLLKVQVGYPDAESEQSLLANHARGFNASRPETYALASTLTSERLTELRGECTRVRVEPELIEYVTGLVCSTRDDPTLLLGASPRASVALFQAARAAALIAGRDYVVPDDVKQLALPVLRHRVLLGAEAQIDGVTADERVADAIRNVAAPS